MPGGLVFILLVMRRELAAGRGAGDEGAERRRPPAVVAEVVA